MMLAALVVGVQPAEARASWQEAMHICASVCVSEKEGGNNAAK